MDIPTISVPDQFNVTTAFLDRNLAEGRGAKTAIYYEDERFTYAQIAELTNRVGNGLQALGVEMEQRVALLLLDSPEFAASFFGAIRLGAVAVPMNTLLRPDDYVYMLNDSRAKALLIHAALWESLIAILPRLLYLRHVVVVGLEARLHGTSLDGARGKVVLHDFAQWTAAASPELEPAATSKDDSAFWLYSSGSTGFPKGCVHLHHDMLYCQETYARHILNIREDDITFSTGKLFFAYGLGNALYFPFGVGASTVLYPGRALPEEVLRIVAQYRPTIFYAVPTLYAGILALPDGERRFDFSSVRLCVSSGEALPVDIMRRWEERFGLSLLNGIGSTEVLHIFISNREGEIRPGSTGRVVPGYEARIVDEQGNDVREEEIGNLLISGDSTAAYYWNKHEKTKETINGRWIHTGDKYYMDADGYFWYCGRSDDMLRVSGQWVSPIEVESALVEHPAVLEAAVVGALDSAKLVKPKAYIVLRAGYEASQALAEEIQNFVKSRLAPFKYPRQVEFLQELPKTATGKTQRFKLRSTPDTEPL